VDKNLSTEQRKNENVTTLFLLTLVLFMNLLALASSLEDKLLDIQMFSIELIGSGGYMCTRLPVCGHV